MGRSIRNAAVPLCLRITASAFIACINIGAAAAEKQPLTVADAIQTARVMPGAGTSSASWALAPDGKPLGPEEQVLVSPDGKRYAIMLVRGDVKRNGTWMELISGRLDSLDAAARYETAAKLFTTSLGSNDASDFTRLTYAHFNPVSWLDDSERVTFSFSDGNGPIQAVAVNVRTHRVEYLTRHSTDVQPSTVGPGGSLIYTAKVPRSLAASVALLRRGFTVTNADVMSLLRGNADGFSELENWNRERYLVTRKQAKPRRIRVNADGFDRGWPLFNARFSPDGRWVLIDGSPDRVPVEWERYGDDFFKLMIREAQHNRDGFAARQVRQLFVVDAVSGAARPLWRLPKAPLLWNAAWSPDSRSVIVPSTFLPPEQGAAAGLAGKAVAEVDIASGAFQQLPMPPELAPQGFADVRWELDGIVEVKGGERPYRFRKVEGRWQPVAEAAPPPSPSAPISIEVRQDLNTPPTVWAVDRVSGRERMILDPNPELRARFALGRVQHLNWQDGDGRTWSGLLYYPVHHDPMRRFPLVIQTHGHAPVTSFSLYGTGPGPLTLGLGPGFSVFAAQPLANRDIAVLQVEDKAVPGVDGTPREAAMYMSAYEAAIRRLDADGLVDTTKVGLVGYSRTGWHVEYALTHSRFPYAAAIAADNFDAGYFQYVLAPIDATAALYGTAPVGDGLKEWIKHAPAFNADKVRTPLRLQVESPGLPQVLYAWEMLSRLRQLKKPVELYVIPDIEHGSHGLQNSAQCLAAQQGAVDWFDFWLNGRENPAPDRVEQNARWRALRALHDAGK